MVAIWEYLLIYLISGIIGSLFSLWLNPIYSNSMGASGAIFGIMGAAFIVNARQNKNYFLFSLIYIVWDIYRSFDPGIGTWAHIFGLACGLILGFIIHRRKYNQSKHDFK
jgi:membrane associated rhomboid family serine protease